jgi:hypothetical protein
VSKKNPAAKASEKSKAKRKRMEFSQKVCIIGLCMVGFMLLSNVALAYLGRQLLNDITVACITCFGGFATGGYYALAGTRDASLNKYGLRIPTEDSPDAERGKHFLDRPTAAGDDAPGI